MNTGKALKQLRAWRGVSQESLAKLSGVSETEIGRIEGGGNPTLLRLGMLASALEVSLASLIILASDDGELDCLTGASHHLYRAALHINLEIQPDFKRRVVEEEKGE